MLHSWPIPVEVENLLDFRKAELHPVGAVGNDRATLLNAIWPVLKHQFGADDYVRAGRNFPFPAIGELKGPIMIEMELQHAERSRHWVDAEPDPNK
ncbi:MAG: hypothetical protein L0215_10280 [Gemmataceae bacterium]|nr:hypothetical protein [Gemmataceae bacterium]